MRQFKKDGALSRTLVILLQLEQMELEIRGLSSQVERDRGLTRLRSHQAELKRLTKLYNVSFKVAFIKFH